jgi:WD40 repeat protein
MKVVLIGILILLSEIIIAQKPNIMIQGGHLTDIKNFTISPDGNYLFSIDGLNKGILWDVKNGRQLSTFNELSSASFKTDSRSILIVEKDKSIATFDLMGKRIDVSFPDIKSLSSQGWIDNDHKKMRIDNTLVDIKYDGSYKYYKTEEYHKQAAYSSITNTFCVSTKGFIHFFNAEDATKTGEINISDMNGDYMTTVDFSADGTFLLANDPSQIQIFDINAKKSIKKISVPTGQKSFKAKFLPNGKQVLLLTNVQLHLYDIASGQTVWAVNLPPNLSRYYESNGNILFSKNGEQIFASYNKDIFQFDAANGRLINSFSATLAASASEIRLYNQSQNLATRMNYASLAYWDLKTGTMTISPKIDKFWNDMVVLNKQKTVVHAVGNKVLGIEFETGKKAFELDVEEVFKIGGSFDDKYLFTVGNNKEKSEENLTIIDVKNTKILYKLPCDAASKTAFANTSYKIATLENNAQNSIVIYDAATGQVADKKKIATEPQEKAQYQQLLFSPNDTYLALTKSNNVTILNLKGDKKIDVPIDSKYATRYIFSQDEKYLIFLSSKFGIQFYDIAKEGFDFSRGILNNTPYFIEAALSKNGRFLFASDADNTIKVFDLNERKLVATLYSFNSNNNWAVLTPDGRFDGTQEAQREIYFVKGLDVIPLVSMFEKFYTPHLLSRILDGEKFDPVPVNIDELKSAPTVKIIYENKQRNLVVSDDIPSYNIDNEQVTLKIQADCPSDVVTEIQLFQNGKLVGSTRNLIVEDDKPNGEKSLLKTFNVVLNNGENRFKAIALNSQRTESQPDEIILNFKPKTTPSVSGGSTSDIQLYLIVVGINKYKNPKYNLNYATADATSFKEAIEKGGTSIFSKTNVLFIGDDKATKTGISDELEKVKTTAKAQDVFIFYYAGHGVLNNKKEFYLVPHDVTQLYGADDALAQKGLSANQLQQFSKDIKAQKQLFILDACQSAGALDQVMASRGAAEEKAIAQLARATGTHWLTASGSEQFASEFTQLGHGTFTYVLLEALSGKADKGGDKKITVKELDAYLQEVVPEVTAKYKGTPQYPASYGFGNDFPIGVVKQ